MEASLFPCFDPINFFLLISSLKPANFIWHYHPYERPFLQWIVFIICGKASVDRSGPPALIASIKIWYFYVHVNIILFHNLNGKSLLT